MSPSVGKDANFQSWHRWQRQIPSMPLAIPDPLGPHTSGGRRGSGDVGPQGDARRTGEHGDPAPQRLRTRTSPSRHAPHPLARRPFASVPRLSVTALSWGQLVIPAHHCKTNVFLQNVSRKYAFCFLSSSNVIPLAQTVSAEPKWLASDLVAWAPGP